MWSSNHSCCQDGDACCNEPSQNENADHLSEPSALFDHLRESSGSVSLEESLFSQLPKVSLSTAASTLLHTTLHKSEDGITIEGEIRFDPMFTAAFHRSLEGGHTAEMKVNGNSVFCLHDVETSKQLFETALKRHREQRHEAFEGLIESGLNAVCLRELTPQYVSFDSRSLLPEDSQRQFSHHDDATHIGRGMGYTVDDFRLLVTEVREERERKILGLFKRQETHYSHAAFLYEPSDEDLENKQHWSGTAQELPRTFAERLALIHELHWNK
jgi:hypothetical protein